MMKEEFEDMIGYRVSQAIYDDIEFVYMNDDRFHNKQQIVDWWNKYDYGGKHGIHGLKCEILAKQAREKAIEEGRVSFRWDRRTHSIEVKVIE